MKSKTIHNNITTSNNTNNNEPRAGIEMRCGDLKTALVGLGKVVPSGNPVAELGYVKVEPRNRQVAQLTATDLDVTLRLAVPAQCHPQCEAFLVPLAQLRELARKQAAGESIPLHPSAQAPATAAFPEHPSWRGIAVPLADAAVTSLLRAFACSSDDDTRFLLQGAFLDVGDKGKNAHRIVATDGKLLYSSNSMHLPDLKASIIVPDHKLWKWKALAESRPWTLHLGKANPKAANGANTAQPFRIDGPFWSVSGTVTDGKYPNYRQVIPPDAEFKTRILLTDGARETIARLLPKLPGAGTTNRAVGIELRDRQLFLLARESDDQPWQPHPLGRCESRGPDVRVQVNRDYLRRPIDFGLHEINIIDERSPIRFQRDGDLMIVMPLRSARPPQAATRRLNRARFIQPSAVSRSSRPTKNSRLHSASASTSSINGSTSSRA